MISTPVCKYFDQVDPIPQALKWIEAAGRESTAVICLRMRIARFRGWMMETASGREEVGAAD